MPGSYNMSIRVDPTLKSQAEDVLSQLGMNMTGAINMFLAQIVRDQAVPLSLSLNSPAVFSTRSTLRGDLLAAKRARDTGFVGRTTEDLIADMDQMIAEAEQNGGV